MTTTLTARLPEDLLAAVPVVLGFHPHESLVMLTFDAESTFHARLDLPPPEELEACLPEVVDALLGPARAHGVGRVAFVFYGADGAVAARLSAALRPAFAAAGIGVVDVLRAHGGRWRRVSGLPGHREPEPRDYDGASHPFAAQAVFEGRVTHGSREALRATLAPVPEQQRRVARRQRTRAGPGPAEAGWVCDLVARCAAAGVDPDEEEAARALLALTRVDVRDAALFAVTRENASDHLRVWSGLLRRAPEAQVPETAVVTAFCAWQSGHGALAWCALDRCLAAEPDHRLALCLAECLTRAVPPAAWEGVAARSGPEGDTA